MNNALYYSNIKNDIINNEFMTINNIRPIFKFINNQNEYY